MRQLGIDMGTASIRIVVLENKEIVFAWRQAHHGRILDVLSKGLQKVCLAFPSSEELPVGVTGSNAPLLSHLGHPITQTAMIPATVEGVRTFCPGAGSVIDIGGQGSRFISGVKTKAPQFHANEHCAGGTGSFFEDQMQRLGLKIGDYSQLVMKAKSVPSISGRCSVFAKTDIIHRQQEGATTPDILLGLCYALARNYKAAIIRSLPVEKPVVFLGGVTQNAGMKRALLDVLSLEETDLVIPDHAEEISAAGAALLADESILPEELLQEVSSLSSDIRNGQNLLSLKAASIPDVLTGSSSLPPLIPEPGTEIIDPPATGIIPSGGVYLGIDIGSTSTDLVMMGDDGTLVDYQYLRTAGDPEEAVRRGLSHIAETFGEVPFKAVGVTGSGRMRVGKMIGADVIRDEITAQAKGAVSSVPDVDTVFEIGGQDSKFISIKDGRVLDFQMNKICAAGTGSFVEEQASRMSIPLDEFGQMGVKSRHPSVLGERCTVFMESSIDTALGSGALPEDISAGLSYAIVRNYLTRVVAGRKVGNRIVLQGGVCYNPSIVAAFQKAYPGKTTVNPYFSISGAVGAALLAKQAGITKSAFRGYHFSGEEPQNDTLKEEIQKNKAFFHRSEKLLVLGYTGRIDPSKKTVGIPYVLLMHHLFPLVNTYFTALGYNVLLSDASNDETIRRSQQYAMGETCYPVKLMYGHMQQLIDKKVDYIFMPLVHTMTHEKALAKYNYGCMYMQTAALSIGKILHAKENGVELLTPVLDLNLGMKAMASAMIDVGVQLGRSRPASLAALLKGAAAFRKYNAALVEQGKELLSSVKPDEKVFVIVTRPYGIADPVLNMDIPDILLEHGQKVITMEHLPADDVDLSSDYPDMYWPFGQHILSAAKLIRHHPNLYAVYLTNHGCGPDTMLMHMFAEEMGDKPCLQIEVDEQYSAVGIITRIEAFLQSLEGRKTEPLSKDFDLLSVSHEKKAVYAAPLPGKKLMLPCMGVYSDHLKSHFEKVYGVPTEVLAPFTKDVLAEGKAMTSSKEYLPFAALLGEVITKEHKRTTASKAAGDLQYYIPSTLGAEADGQYVWAMKSALDMAGMKDVPLVTEALETLPLTHPDIRGFFFSVLAADKEMLQNGYAGTSAAAALGMEGKVTNGDPGPKVPVPQNASALGIVGTPLSLTTLSEGVLETLAGEGWKLLYAPLSEYLLFLWEEEPQVKKNHAADLLWMRDELQRNLPDTFSDMDSLHNAANRYLGPVSGANIRYRFAKAVDFSRRVQGILLVAPRYENADMVMRMRGIDAHCACPVYHLSFDGDWDEGAGERLSSFLYYCQKN